jgi:hypothetical protein
MTVINIMFYGTNVLDRGAPKGWLPGCSPPKTPKLKFKKHRFCEYDDIKGFT